MGPPYRLIIRRKGKEFEIIWRIRKIDRENGREARRGGESIGIGKVWINKEKEGEG